jgi:hypothetical protein
MAKGLGDLGRLPSGYAKKFWPHANFTDLITDSTKTLKSNARYPGWYNAVMYLAPGTAADWWLEANGREKVVGWDLCPRKTQGCFGEHGENCIFTTGQLRLPVGQQAMVNRTIFMAQHRDEFMRLMFYEISELRRRAREDGRRLALRLNGTSDIRWESDERFFTDEKGELATRAQGGRSVIEHHPDVQWYDYSKIETRFPPHPKAKQLPANYRLTFSSSENNDEDVERVLKAGGNVALVFDIRPTIGSIHMAPMVKVAYGYPVIDGDLHDLRFLDPPGVIVGLRAKGALRDVVKTGDAQFVRYVFDTPEYATETEEYHPDNALYPLGPATYKGPAGRRGRLENLGSPSEEFVRIGVVRGNDIPDAKQEIAMADIDVTNSFPRRAPTIDDLGGEIAPKFKVGDRVQRIGERDTPTGTVRSRNLETAEGGYQFWSYIVALDRPWSRDQYFSESALTSVQGSLGHNFTFGVMPTFEVFEEHFEQAIGDRPYVVRLNPSDSRAADGTSFGDGDYTARQLYKAVSELRDKFENGDESDEPAGLLASTVLQTIGIEWV